MKSSDTWVLDYCSPVSWTVDLTPPEGEWDYEVQLGSEDERMLNAAIMTARGEAARNELGNFFSAIGKNVSSVIERLVEAASPLVKAFAIQLDEQAKIIAPFIDEDNKRTEEFLKEHGNHTVKSIKPGINLPIRTFNSGPQVKRTGRRQTG